jgi:phenylalanyl-tRNA synthetase beta chain
VQSYVRIANPIANDRYVLRRSLLSSVLEVVERNALLRDRMMLFEMGPVFEVAPHEALPCENLRLAIAITGRREPASWQDSDAETMDFFDLKGILQGFFEGLRLDKVRYIPGDYPAFHPGKCARIMLGEIELGVIGELHPLVHGHYELSEAPLEAADLDLQAILDHIPERVAIETVPVYPPVLEDLAVIVEENIPAERVEAVIRKAGGKILTNLYLFDLYRGDQIGTGKKSLAYSLTYQASDRTLKDEEVLNIRQRIIRDLEQELSAHLRS